MTTDYISQLSTLAFESIAPDEWKSFEKLAPDLAGKPADAAKMAQALEANVPLQAAVAWSLGYTPSKWLLENELVEVQKRRDECGIGKKPVSAQAADSGTAAGTDKDPYLQAADMGLMGLCFSGGGIRSATFNLGILQGLAELDLLSCFDYLSSVSGGGYIHQWLATWGKRKGFSGVREELIPLPETGSPKSHPEPLRWLRRYSNYLTPEKGLFTADTWVTIATWVRNTVLNQIILISSLLFVMLIPHLVTFNLFVPSSTWAIVITIAAVVYFFLLAVALIWRELALLDDDTVPTIVTANASAIKQEKRRFLGQSGVQWLVVMPLLAASFLITLLFPVQLAGFQYAQGLILVPALFFFLTITVTFAGGTMTAYLRAHHFITRDENARNFFLRRSWCFAHVRGAIAFVLLLLAALVVTAAGTAWHLLISSMTVWLPRLSGDHLWRLELLIAPPLYLFGPLFSVLLLIGLIGRTFKDSRREWLARLGAWVGLYMLVWLVFVGGSLFGLVILQWMAKLGSGIPALAGWAGTWIWSILAGNSSKTAGAKDDKGPSKFSALEIVAKVGPYVFVAGLLLLLSALAEFITRGHDALHLLAAMFIAAVICLLFAWRVDINDFSMHAYYRDRLARCYLGASNPDRKPNPFTGFDEEDANVAVSSLSPSNGYLGPYPIFCTTLNLTFGEDLAWQERKGASFAFTPLLSGYDVGWTAAKYHNKELRFNGYAETATYAYPAPGIHISTAAAISGAAMSPNWGYHTNSATAFLLTVFNVRLGWWLRNPRTIAQDGKRVNIENASSSRRDKVGFFHDPYPAPSPHFSLLSLTNELLGRTNDTSKYLYLTDGGHFDNMGLYELVRRRCRYIVICDAEQDGELTFEGIGMAIRKCRIDFGAEITLDLRPLQHLNGGSSNAHCVVGTIQYQEDTAKRNQEDTARRSPGIVVYIKSSLTGDEPADVLNYKRADPCFPHDSTANQWFTESQFESYRRLGHHIAMVTFAAASPSELPCTDLNGRHGYFLNLKKIWAPFTPEMQQYSAAHSKAYGELLQKIRGDAELPGFFEMLFDREPGRKSWVEQNAGQFDHAVQISFDLIEFMFVVYLQLKLIYPENLNHPFAEGWMYIFKSWALIDVIREGWRKYGPGYAQAFQIFATKQVEMPALPGAQLGAK
jgi:hypothetical protein